MLDHSVLLSLSANQKLAEDVAKLLGTQLGKRTITHFPLGEVIVEPVDSVRGKNVYILHSTCPPMNENLMETLIFIDTLKRASAKEINLITPYFGYARQDRKAKPRQPITSALVAHLLTTEASLGPEESPSSVTGTSAKYQRQLAVAIKNARFVGLLPVVK